MCKRLSTTSGAELLEGVGVGVDGVAVGVDGVIRMGGVCDGLVGGCR